MLKINQTGKAKQDLLDIWNYIAEDNIVAADSVVDDVAAALNLVSQFPLSAQFVPHIAPDVRRISVGRYRIYFRTVESKIEVLRVLHERRQQVLNN